MAAVSVQTGPIAADDPARDVPPEKWFNLTLARRSAVHVRIPYDCRALLGYVREAETHRMWEQTGHADLSDYIRRGLEVDPELLEWARIGLSAFEEGEAVSLDKAAEMGRKIASIEPALEHGGARDGAGRKAKDEDGNQVEHFDMKKAKRTGNSNASPERVIARLKRDAQTDPNAQALLDTLAAGDISARQAALQMGYIKPADPARIVEKQREKMTPDEQATVWREWGRALPDEVLDRVQVAKEAFLNLTEQEARSFMEWANARVWSTAA